MNEICGLLGSRYPLIQGAMGVICNPEMVAAVSEAGGYGLLASAFLTEPGPLREQIEAVKKAYGQTIWGESDGHESHVHGLC